MTHAEMTDQQSTIAIETVVPSIRWIVISSPGLPECVVIGNDVLPNRKPVLKLVGQTWQRV